MISLLVSLALAGNFVADESAFLADPAWPVCGQEVITGFEEAPMASYVGDRYGGVTVTTSTVGALIDDDVAGTACRDTRCARVPILEGYGSGDPQWFAFALTYPSRVLSFWVVDFGTSSGGGTATVDGYLEGALVESFDFTPGGDDEDGGAFVGLVFDTAVDEVILHTAVAGDGIGIDDLRFPPDACHDGDGDGQNEYEGDCDDVDAEVYPGAPELCDGVDNACAGSVPAEEADSDFDGWRDCVDTDVDGVTTAGGDCAPWDASVFPGAPELCDGLDNACAGALPLPEDDGDHDGWIDCRDTDADGVTTAAGDCAPWDATVFPGAPERCDGLDNACAGVLPADEGDLDFDQWIDCLDTDGDGVTTALGDCEAWDATVYPGAPELCDGRDNTCAGLLPDDEGDLDFDQWIDCLDTDGDGVTTALGDCEAWDATVYPGAPELCDGLDNMCAGFLPADEGDLDADQWIDCIDTDLDGVTTALGDCDPWDPTVYPGAPELCDRLDNVCAGRVPEDEVDRDRDAFTACEGDCDDKDPHRFPGAAEGDNGSDDNCDGRASGGVVGCSHTPPRAGWMILGIVIGAVLLRRRADRASRRTVLLAASIAAAPVLAALPAGLADYTSEITDPAYAEELAATNHGRQIVFQLSEHAVKDILVDWLHANPSSLSYARDWSLPSTLPWMPSSMDFGLSMWMSGSDLRFLDGERIEITLSWEGILQELSGTIAPSTIIGDVVVGADLVLVEDTTVTPTVATVELDNVVVDTSGLLIDGYLGTGPFSSWVPDAIERAVGSALSTFSFDVSPLYGVLDEALLPESITGGSANYSLSVGIANTAIKTIEVPTNGGDSLVMIGANLVSLPACHASAATSGEHTLFSNSAWNDFEASLIPPGDDVALSISTRLLDRLFWNMVWNAETDGTTVWESTRAIEHDLANFWAVTSYDFDRETYWEWFVNKRAVADSTKTRCDGWSDGSQVLDVDAEGNPYFRVRYWVHLGHGLGCDSTGGFSVWLRFFVHNAVYGEPELYLDLSASSELNPTSWADFVDALGCSGTDAIHEAERELTGTTTAITASGLRRLFTLHHTTADDVTYALARMTPHPATLTFSGRVGTPTSPLEWGDPWSPPVGTILGLNAGRPDDPVLANGSDPTQRLCPPGYETVSVTVDGVPLDWCEYADTTTTAEVRSLPANAWCGVDVHPRNRTEICDNEDNDGDGSVDENFSASSGAVDLSGVGIADCFAELGGGDSDTTNDSFPVEYDSTCGGMSPRDGCPAGFTQHPIWVDSDYALCLVNPAGCTVSAAELLAEADVVTCLADGSGFDAADVDRLPEGIVGAGYVGGYAEAVTTFDGAPCAAPFVEVSQDAGIGDTRVFYWDAAVFGYRWVSLGADARHLIYCTTAGPGGDADGDGLTAVEETSAATDAADWSTDGDILGDALEVNEGLDPTREDGDGDGLTDFTEWLVLHTDPADTDSDDDGLPDGYEQWVTLTDPLEPDDDGDGILDGDEESLQDIDDDWFEGLGPNAAEALSEESEGVPDTDPSELGSGG